MNAAAVPFGYAIQGKKIVVDEDRAEIVRHIFRSYLSGQSMAMIASQLNQEAVHVRTGNESHRWAHTAISYILSNERYIGDSLWQKTYATDTLPAQQVKNRGDQPKYLDKTLTRPLLTLKPSVLCRS